MNRPAAIVSIVLACLLLALGRYCIRRAKREEIPRRRLRGRLLGWTLLFAGLLAMILGVVIW